MTNLETIQFLYSNYNLFLKAKAPRETIEDCLSTVAQRLLSKDDYEIENPKSFITTALHNELNILRRKSKLLIFNDYPQDVATECIITQISEEQHQREQVRNMYEAIEDLPQGQKAALHYYLTHGKFSAAGGAMESMRTNYKLGLAKLQSRLGL